MRQASYEKAFTAATHKSKKQKKQIKKTNKKKLSITQRTINDRTLNHIKTLEL
jgi:hypothetical protein